jgi:hypothetical protein
MVTVIPAYGRDYTTAKAAKADWENGKDFIIASIKHPADGKLCSIQDGLQVSIRFNRFTKMVTP